MCLSGTLEFCNLFRVLICVISLSKSEKWVLEVGVKLGLKWIFIFVDIGGMEGDLRLKVEMERLDDDAVNPWTEEG